MRHLLRFEKKNQQLLPKKEFQARLLNNIVAGTIILSFFLLVGILGYHATCGFTWIDSLLNASMILSGMGPTNTIPTDAGKVFASVYALVSGVIFITTIGIVLAPVVHRFFHRFHVPDGGR